MFVARLMLAVPTGFALMIATSISEIGWRSFWRHLFHPHVDSTAYDALFGSLLGAIAVLLAITAASFVAGATILRVDDTRRRRLEVLVDSRLWFFPSTLLAYSITGLGSTAYGFPRYSSAVLVEAALGVCAWFAFVALNARSAGEVLARKHPD